MLLKDTIELVSLKLAAEMRLNAAVHSSITMWESAFDAARNNMVFYCDLYHFNPVLLQIVWTN